MAETKIEHLLKSTAIISIGSIGSSAIKMLNVLFFTYFVSVSQVGDYDVVLTYAGLLSPIAALALYEAAFRWLLDDSHDQSETASTTFFVTIVAMAIICTLLSILFVTFDYTYTIELIAVIVTQGLHTYSQFLARGLKRNKVYAVQGIVYSLILITCNLILVVLLPFQAAGLLWSVAIANLCAFAFAFSILKVHRGLVSLKKVKPKHITNYLKYSLPIVPNNISWWLVSASNRLLINWTIGSSANGIFAISNKFPTVLNLVTTFFYQAWQEQAISEFSSKDRDAYYTRIFNIYSRILISGIAILLPLSALAIHLFVAPDFRDSIRYLGPLFLSCMFSAFAAFYGTGYLSTRQTAGALGTTVAGAVVSIAVVVAGIYQIGLYAAALGSMIGNLTIWLLRARQTRKYFNIQIEPLPMLLGIVAVSLCSIVISNASVITLISIEALSVFFSLVFCRKVIGKMIELVKAFLAKRRS